MKKTLLSVFSFLLLTSLCYAADDVFTHTADTSKIKIPTFKDTSCKFEQEKHINGNVIKSGGAFRFILKKGVIFKTLYPIKYTTTYNSKENKYVNDIIISISKKNFSAIEKNFNIYFKEKSPSWTMGLIPKTDSVAHEHIKNIIIKGEKDINGIMINTVKNGYTVINFTQCE